MGDWGGEMSFCHCFCFWLTCSLGLLHDQFSNSDSDDRFARQGKNLHVQEADTLPQLDWSAY